MGPLGVQEMLAIFVLALLLFGPKKLPELGRMLGKALSEFRRAKNELRSTFESHLSELEREVQVDNYSASNTANSSPRFPYPYDESGRQESDITSFSSDESRDSGAAQLSNSASLETRQADVPQAGVRENASADDLPVAGTVPRSNGHRSAAASITAEEKQSA